MRLVTIRPEHAGRHWSVPILTFFTHFSIWVEVHNGPFIYCEAQGKGRAKGRLRKVTQMSFMDGGWWMVDILSLMLYIKFGRHPPPPPTPTYLPPGSLLISRIKLINGPGEVGRGKRRCVGSI